MYIATYIWFLSQLGAEEGKVYPKMCKPLNKGKFPDATESRRENTACKQA